MHGQGEAERACPKCGFLRIAEEAVCRKCGVIFAKIRGRPDAHEAPHVEVAPATSGDDEGRSLLFFVADNINPVYFAGRIILWLVLMVFAVLFLFQSPPEVINGGVRNALHLVSLVYHEAGHYFIFRFFGEFIMYLGGTLGQMLIPVICLLAFLFKTRDTFAASAALWWFGYNFQDISPYINDARSMVMPLLGGIIGQDYPDSHDWNYILGTLGMLRYDRVLASLSYHFGSIVMFIAIAWGGVVLIKQYRRMGDMSGQ